MRPAKTGDLFLFLIFVSFSFLLFGFDKSHVLEPAKVGFSYISDPIQSKLFGAKKAIFNQIEILSKLKSLESENRRLLQNKVQLEGEIERLKEKDRENKALILQLGVPESKEHKLLPAKTVGLNRYLVIDKGEGDGVRTGQTVIFGNNLVGKIIQTTATLSRVRLPVDPESKIQAVLYSDNKITGVAVGNFGTNILLDKISQDETVKVGQAVLTEGDEGNYPKGLVIGKIENVKKEDVQLFQHIEVTPALSYKDLDLVFVVTG